MLRMLLLPAMILCSPHGGRISSEKIMGFRRLCRASLSVLKLVLVYISVWIYLTVPIQRIGDWLSEASARLID